MSDISGKCLFTLEKLETQPYLWDGTQAIQAGHLSLIFLAALGTVLPQAQLLLVIVNLYM